MNDPSSPTEDAGTSAPGAQLDGHHLIQQAEVAPLDVDGVQAATVGTVIFAVATVIMVITYDRLVAADDGWWLGVAASGLGLGLISLTYTISHRRRRRRRSTVPGPTA